MNIIGMVFGKITNETPKYEVIQSTTDYEIRKYPSSVVAEVTYDPTQFKGDKDAGISILGDYIGALKKPQNTKPDKKIAMTAPVITKTTSESEKIAMTAPVITKAAASEKIAMTAPVITKAATASESEKIAMTAPVLTKEVGDEKLYTAQFFLPSIYSKVEDAPKPLNEKVIIREVGEKKVAVVTFSGVCRDSVVKEKVEELKKSLERDGHKIIGDFELARYNPPITLPSLRTNEVRIPLE